MTLALKLGMAANYLLVVVLIWGWHIGVVNADSWVIIGLLHFGIGSMCGVALIGRDLS